MKNKSGKEMRKLMLAVSLSVLVLVLAIIAYFMVDVIVTTNSNMEENKEKVIDESVRSLNEISELASMSNIDANVMRILNPEMIENALTGGSEALYQACVDVVMTFYPVEYVGIVKNGEVVKFRAAEGFDIDVSEMPTQPPQGDYGTLDSLGDRQGFFVSVFNPIDLSMIGIPGEFYFNLIADRTDEIAGIEDYFNSQRSDMILRMGIAAAIAIILSLLLTTLGLRYFTHKYVVDPIEELNRQAEEITAGTFSGEVEVDEDSAYAALQGLLRSGQKVLQHMEEEMED